MAKLKLKWEVVLQSGGLFYYKGRGDSPKAALIDLRESMQVGMGHADEELQLQQRRLSALTDYIESVEDIVT